MKFYELQHGAHFVFAYHKPTPQGVYNAADVRVKFDHTHAYPNQHPRPTAWPVEDLMAEVRQVAKVNGVWVDHVGLLDDLVQGHAGTGVAQAVVHNPATTTVVENIDKVLDGPKHFIGKKGLDTEEQKLVTRAANATTAAYLWVRDGLKAGEIFRGLAGEADARYAKNSVEFSVFIATAALFSEGIEVELDDIGYIRAVSQPGTPHTQD